MSRTIPYFSFAGTCEDALAFYSEVLQGSITSIMRYADSPMEIPEEYGQKVLHSSFRAGDILFYASDAFPGAPVSAGGNIEMMIEENDLSKVDGLFAALADGGVIRMPIDNTFWGARFGACTDKYGIQWMVHCQLPGQE